MPSTIRSTVRISRATRRLVPLTTVLVGVGLAACSGTPADDAGIEPSTGSSASALFTDSSRTMAFVAHEDDDIGAFGPTAAHTIQSGATYQVVMLTSGDAFTCSDSSGYIDGREQGELAAYAQTLGVSYDAANPKAAWKEEVLQLPSTGKWIRKETLKAHPSLSVVYIGLGSNDNLDLQRLWNNAGTTISTLAYDERRKTVSASGVVTKHVDTYTRAQLIATLRELVTQFAPTQINTLDSSRLWGDSFPWDHTDHVHSALFALAAAQGYPTAHGLRTYRTYNVMLTEPENVNADDGAFTAALMDTYGKYDKWFPQSGNCSGGSVTICNKSDVCQDPAVFWGGMMVRSYPIVPEGGTTGFVVAPDGKCLAAASSLAAGSSVTTATCANVPAQQWNVRTDGTIKQLSSGLCLSAVGSTGTLLGQKSLTLQTCAALGASTNALDQQFALMSNGQLRGPEATCISVTSSVPTTQACADDPKQEGWHNALAAGFNAGATGFGDAAITGSETSYRTLAFADVSGDGKSDACYRAAGGIYCGVWNATSGTFGAPTLWLAKFRDADGFNAAKYGDTIMFGDVNHDGKADVCGRASGGIVCAHSMGTSFNATTYGARTSAFDFSDFVGYDGNFGYYGSIRLADVNKDGWLDVCGRNASGVECALNKKATSGTFNGVSQWLTSEFTDGLGWNDEAYGGTLQYADVDGDGWVDVCGRATDGIRCAINQRDGAHFFHPHLWGASDDFDDATGWSADRNNYFSIHLADINGDGRADLCGRSGAGLVCGLSMGEAFSKSQSTAAFGVGFADAAGWNTDPYGSTVSFANLNGDTHLDVCGHGPLVGAAGSGIRCAYAP